MSVPTRDRPAAAVPRLADKVAFLQQPGHYPEAPAAVETVATHMSWVFLTDRFAYKLKKPVKYDFLDFSTLEARHRDCLAEVRLNRRLADDVYRRVLPLTRDRNGQLALDGAGEPVEWLVHMRRLPRASMLDWALAHGEVSMDAVRRLGFMLAQFYAHAPAVATTAQEYVARFSRDIDANERELTQAGYPLSRQRVETLCQAQRRFLQTHGRELAQRVAQGRIVEGHGDLRPEHVCLAPEPVIIDCLEFNREFRLLDPADELAFFALECERLGSPPIGNAVFELYEQITSDRVPAALVQFYLSFRAVLRAKIAIWHLRDHEVPHHSRWVQRAQDYLHLAARHSLPA